jgi:hypothetical protein
MFGLRFGAGAEHLLSFPRIEIPFQPADPVNEKLAIKVIDLVL